MYVCVCHAVTDRDIHQAVANGTNTLRGLRQELKVATCCGLCAGCARDVLEEAQASCTGSCEKKSCSKDMPLAVLHAEKETAPVSCRD